MAGDHVVGVAGHEDWLDFEPLGQLLAAHAGHHHVGEQEVDLAGVRVPGVERARAVGGLEHVVALAREDAAGEAPDGRLVLDHEDRLALGGRLVAVARTGARRRAPRRSRGGAPRSSCPAPGVESISILPPGLGHDAVDGRQAEAGALALRLGRVEGLEGALHHVRRHAGRRCRARPGAPRARRRRPRRSPARCAARRRTAWRRARSPRGSRAPARSASGQPRHGGAGAPRRCGARCSRRSSARAAT